MFSSVLYSLLLSGALISFQEPAEGAPEGSRVLSPAQLAELEQAFIAFDVDGSGFIDKKELKSLLLTTGMAKANVVDAEVNSLIRTLDADSSGTIDFQEFCQMMLGGAQSSPESAKELFKTLDVDGNGYVTGDEMRSSPLFDSRMVKFALKEADDDKDGRFTINEFNILLQKMEN